jgi:hypothetical protein
MRRELDEGGGERRRRLLAVLVQDRLALAVVERDPLPAEVDLDRARDEQVEPAGIRLGRDQHPHARARILFDLEHRAIGERE